MSDERKVSERYRSLSREEPPRHLDDAILAAARRAAGTRPAPLVVPTGRQRWYFPLAAAAIIVLAVAVTTHVEREQPDPEAQVAAPVTAPEPPAREPTAPGQVQEQVFAPDPNPAPSKKKSADPTDERRELRRERDRPALADLQKAPTPAPATPAPASPPPAELDAAARSDAQGARSSGRVAASAKMRQEAGALANFASASPDQVLQGIADLRRQGRHEEADQALAEFRKRYPDYKISAEMLEKVEKR